MKTSPGLFSPEEGGVGGKLPAGIDGLDGVVTTLSYYFSFCASGSADFLGTVSYFSIYLIAKELFFVLLFI